MDPENHAFLFLFEKIEFYPGCLCSQFADAIQKLPKRFMDGKLVINPLNVLEIDAFCDLAETNAIIWDEVTVEKATIDQRPFERLARTAYKINFQ